MAFDAQALNAGGCASKVMRSEVDTSDASQPDRRREHTAHIKARIRYPGLPFGSRADTRMGGPKHYIVVLCCAKWAALGG